MTAIRLPWLAVRMWFRSVVLPAPRKPVKTVTGTRVVAVAAIGRYLSGERSGVSSWGNCTSSVREGQRGSDGRRKPEGTVRSHSAFRLEKGRRPAGFPLHRAPRLRNGWRTAPPTVER